MTCSEKCQLGLCSYDCEHIPDGFCENIVEVQEKEIKRLEQEIQYLTECDIDSQEENWKWQKLLLIKRDKKHQEEIERLNNIINELEKLLKEEKTRTRYANDVERFTAYDFALKKLQELKGDSSNGQIH